MSQLDLKNFKGKQVRLLKLKINCSLCVLSIKTGDTDFSEHQKSNLINFLSSQKDASQRNFEIKAAIKLILDSSIEKFGNDENDPTEVRVVNL